MAMASFDNLTYLRRKIESPVKKKKKKAALDRLIVKPSVAIISPFEHRLISILARQLR